MRTLDRPWDKNLQLLLVAIIAFNTFPLFTVIPPWATVATTAFLAWKTLYLLRGIERPPRWLLWTLAVATGAGIFASYRTILGQEAASALLVVLTSAKLLETNRYRDAMIVIFTSYFLLMAHLLTSQSLLSTVYMATDVMLITSLMFQAHKIDRRNSLRTLRPVMKILLLALPIWVFLFLAFPRFSTGAWNLTQSNKSTAGFADNMSPGDIDKLTEVDEPAFRAVFRSDVKPPMESLYWRGAVLTEADGLKWGRPKNERALQSDTSRSPLAKSRIEYEISLEPTYRNWLFLLDYPEALTPDPKFSNLGTRERYGFIYETNRDPVSRIFYEGVSTDYAPLQNMSEFEARQMTKLPDSIDPKILALGREFRKRVMQPDASGPPAFSDRLSNEILDWFIAEGFRYTKEPGAMPTDDGPMQLARFLFLTRRGFCEHYAAAFATLARAAGLPARVTVGFHGGKINTIADYVLVRSLDAHAWAEVWREDPSQPGYGRWVRVDPTSVIAPLRLRIGGDYNLLEDTPRDLTAAEFQRRVAGQFSGFSLRAEMAWDAVQMKWNSFLNNYDFEFQKSLLSRFGFGDVPRYVLGAVAIFGVGALVAISNVILRRRKRQTDVLLNQWRALCRKLEGAGLDTRGYNEGPLDFADRAAARWPEKAEEIKHLAQFYCELRYGPAIENSPAERKKFAQSVRRFSIEANSSSAAS